MEHTSYNHAIIQKNVSDYLEHCLRSNSISITGIVHKNKEIDSFLEYVLFLKSQHSTAFVLLLDDVISFVEKYPSSYTQSSYYAYLPRVLKEEDKIAIAAVRSDFNNISYCPQKTQERIRIHIYEAWEKERRNYEAMTPGEKFMYGSFPKKPLIINK